MDSEMSPPSPDDGDDHMNEVGMIACTTAMDSQEHSLNCRVEAADGHGMHNVDRVEIDDNKILDESHQTGTHTRFETDSDITTCTVHEDREAGSVSDQVLSCWK